MKRFSLPAAILALVLPTAGAGESIDLSASDFVERVSETLREPVDEESPEGAETVIHAVPARDMRVEVHFGTRPRIGRVATDFEAAAGGGLAPPAVRPVGERGRLPALVRFDTAGTSAETEARAMVTVARGYRAGGRIETGAPVGGVDVGLSRLLADPCGIDARYRNVPEGGPRVDLPLQAKF